MPRSSDEARASRTGTGGKGSEGVWPVLAIERTRAARPDKGGRWLAVAGVIVLQMLAESYGMPCHRLFLRLDPLGQPHAVCARAPAGSRKETVARGSPPTVTVPEPPPPHTQGHFFERSWYYVFGLDSAKARPRRRLPPRAAAKSEPGKQEDFTSLDQLV